MAMQPLDLITFDTAQLDLRADEASERAWLAANGDAVSLHYFPGPPPIQADLRSVDQVRAFWRQITADAGGAIIEVQTTRIDGHVGIRTVIKMPQEPTGMMYIGAVTRPWRDFSYVGKLSCAEHGITGVRDNTVAMKLKLKGHEFPPGPGGPMQGWMADPYDPSIITPLARNLSEAEEYDKAFPDHPLSRLRAQFPKIEQTIRVAPVLTSEAPFEYEAIEAARPWWKFW